MNKIINTFGSVERSREFLEFAMEQPILRLRAINSDHIEGPFGKSVRAYTYSAVSGFVIGRFEEPEAASIPEAVLPIRPASTSSHNEGNDETTIIPGASVVGTTRLRLINPIHESSQLAHGIQDLLSGNLNTGLTVVTYDLIMDTLGSLEAAHDDLRKARTTEVLWQLSRSSLAGIWDQPGLNS